MFTASGFIIFPDCFVNVGFICKMVLILDHASVGRKFPAKVLYFDKAHCRKLWHYYNKSQQTEN